MLHWEEGTDTKDRPVWLRYVECSHWGLILTAVLPRWIIPFDYERGIAQVKVF